MGKRIAIVGVGAVGGYTGAYMVRAGEDVTFHRFLAGACRRDEAERPSHHPRPGRGAVHAQDKRPACDRGSASFERASIDIAFVCTKSYDIHWAALLMRQYLAPGSYVVSLQNCMNQATIAEVVGWGKTMGCIASNISVGLVEPGHVHRGGVKGDAAHTVYRTGEIQGNHRAGA
jgi:2-dehydropantoate 2-reductase